MNRNKQIEHDGKVDMIDLQKRLDKASATTEKLALHGRLVKVNIFVLADADQDAYDGLNEIFRRARANGFPQAEGGVIDWAFSPGANIPFKLPVVVYDPSDYEEGDFLEAF